MPSGASDHFRLPKGSEPSSMPDKALYIPNVAPVEGNDRMSTEAHGSVNGGHRDIVRQLCQRTGTEGVAQLVFQGLVVVLRLLQDRDLIIQMQQQLVTTASKSFCVYVWLLVLYRSITGRAETHGSLTFMCGTYFMAASSILAGTNVEVLRNRVMQFESRARQKRALDLDWYRGIPISKTLTVDHFDDHAKQYLSILENFGRLGLVDAIIQREYEGPPTSLRKLMQNPQTAETTRRQMLGMLASVDDDLLKSCITRQIARHASCRSHPTKKILKQNLGIAADFPCQYINILCDRIGLPLTNKQCSQIVTDIDLYLRGGVESDTIAESIDQAMNRTSTWPIALSQKGLRRYTDFKQVNVNNLHKQDEHRRYVIQSFLSDLRTQLQKAADCDRPRMIPFVEVGFSNNVKARLKQHAKHTSSNYIMNLFHAVIEHRFPSTFVLHQQVIYLCLDATETWLGEIAFTQLCKAYVDDASGFSHHGAGFSNGSSYRQLTGRNWDAISLYASFLGKISQNLVKEREIAQRWNRTQSGRDHEIIDELEQNSRRQQRLLELSKTFTRISEVDHEIETTLQTMMWSSQRNLEIAHSRNER